MESSDDAGGAGLESSDQAICTISSTPDDQQQQRGGGGGQSQSAVVVRSYECNFCKRGFSNAQALGGHMNIHRKHKKKAISKLNQAAAFSSNATRPLSPIPINTSSVPQYPLDQNYCLATTKWPWIFSPEGDAYDQRLGPADHHQLDLELRLGHAVPDLPQINAWPPAGMKKFL